MRLNAFVRGGALAVLTAGCFSLAWARPIAAYVAPPGLFPAEGNYEGREPVPLPVYDASRRAVVGQLQARKACDGPDCGRVVELVLSRSGNTVRPEVDEWAYETDGLVTYAPAVPSKHGYAFSRLDTALGTFWVETPLADIHSFEALVSVVEGPKTWCTAPGQCVKTPYSVEKELRRVASLVTCYDSPYHVEGVVESGGQRYYRLVLDLSEQPGVSTWLPREAFVPARDAQGEHTGTFYSRGC